MVASPRDATERLRELLAPGTAQPRAHQGYLDLLGDDTPLRSGVAQRLMASRLVPLIYERWWRPALGRVAKGLAGPSMAEEHRWLTEQLALEPGALVLDLACGPGNFTRRLAPLVGPTGLVAGLDASATMLAEAVRRTTQPNVAYLRADAVRPPLREGAFDAVCCFAALHLFAEPFRALDHVVGLLRPGGRIALLTSRRRPSGPLRALDRALGATSGMRMFDPDEIRAALAERGFSGLRQRVAGATQFVAGQHLS
ncbi:class I SAM-dependent methyltransferase [Longimycelium tulufanense]|uniref:class I SAM-dependent methyltransferase n=1 Tax=Longimycelium tulufanense TaxID=907463 RepID=UPI00166DF319|nr:methyltransferase domain-containing protein [Longimycelium tulufanense]